MGTADGGVVRDRYQEVSMQAIRPKQTGGPEVLQLAEFPTPTPGPTEVLVRVEAAGVNFLGILDPNSSYLRTLCVLRVLCG